MIFCLLLLQNLIFRLSFSFCNLIFSVLSLQLFWYFFFFLASTIWYFCSVSAICISTFLQLLQFDISVLSLQLFWYFVFSLIFAKSGISTFLQLLPWHLLSKRLFGYVDYLLIWEFSFLILFLCIVTTRVLFRLLITRFFMSERSRHSPFPIYPLQAIFPAKRENPTKHKPFSSKKTTTQQQLLFPPLLWFSDPLMVPVSRPHQSCLPLWLLPRPDLTDCPSPSPVVLYCLNAG